MPNIPGVPEDRTIHVGLHLYSGTDYDTIVERVEYGGFGVIAFGPNRGREGRMTAYKTLRRELLNDAQTRATFVRECLLWVGLWGHPNVAVAYAVLEMGDAINQRPFLALEYAERGSLRALLRAVQRSAERKLPLDPGLLLAQQIAAGLAYLHRPDPAYRRYEPTVHRDLKPENVLLTGDGRAIITDFGLAKAVERSPVALALLLAEHASPQGTSGGPGGQQGQQAEEVVLVDSDQATLTTSLHTAAGVALGTMAYMPPEQWRDARMAGTAADIYALGIMLSEILAGRHALLDLDQPHSRADWRQAHLAPQPRSLRETAPDVPESVEAIYRRCLAADPVMRPSADEVLAALQTSAQTAGLDVFTPFESAPHTLYNEFVHWHQWGNAYSRFALFDDALACSDRALDEARRLTGERPDLLPATLLTRGTILAGLGSQAWEADHSEKAAEWDRQAEAAYQESLMTRPPATTTEGRQGRSFVWNQLGVFNNERRRYDYAEDAYARAIKLQPDRAAAYFNRALNLWDWGKSEARAGRLPTAIAYLRQARVHAVTSLALGDPTAQSVIQAVEADLERFETPSKG